MDDTTTDDDLNTHNSSSEKPSAEQDVYDAVRLPKRKRLKNDSMVGRRARRTKVKPSSSSRSKHDDVGLDQAIELPAYLQSRRSDFEHRKETLTDRGLLLPPDFRDVQLSGDDRLDRLSERPVFEDLPPPRPYEDIDLPASGGVIPASIGQWLRPYQIEGAKFMHQAFVHQLGVILGDDMGLGKTIQVIAFLTAAFGKTGDERDARRMRTIRRFHGHRWYPRVLLICPGGLLGNWQNELERWGWWNIDQCMGAAKHDAIEAGRSGRLEIMLCSYSMYRLNEGAINEISWDCVIADECHIIKEAKSKVTTSMNNVNALCRIGLTGTAIQNKYDELWTLLNWTNPGQFGSLSTWRKNVSIPLRNGQSHSAKVMELARARQIATKLVTELLPRFFLRRMKSLIADQLPKKSDKIVFCPLTEMQLQAYENFCDSEMMQQLRSSESGKLARATMFPAMILLQKLSNHLALFVPSADSEPERHEKELGFLRDAVPDGWEALYARRDSIHNYANQEYCGKWRVLKKMLKLWHENGDKVLVFSHSVRLLRMLYALFQSKTTYTVSYLDGAMSYEERQRTVDEYNSSSDRFVFLISTRAGGVGLNITSANKVVVFDPNWNPAWDLQAQDRAYRIGQRRDVDVFRLVSVGTIEESIYARQIYKQQQANIGYNASAERRYFKGVQADGQRQGEIFGLQNLLAPPGQRIPLRDIVHQTNVAETRAGVAVADLDVGSFEESDQDQGDDNLHGESQALSELAASIIDPSDQRRGNGGKASKTTKKIDPIQAILASVGVRYTHENAEVIGSSKIEKQISSRAQKAGSDIARGRKAAFGIDEASQLQDTALGGIATDAERPRYKYHPPEDVRRRQFCSMAQWYGLEDVSDFAITVEGWTQEKRRKFLDDFYAERRRILADVAG